MRLAWVIASRYAEVGDDGSMGILGGGIDTLVVSRLRDVSALSLVLAMRVAGTAGKWYEEHVLTVVLKSPTDTDQVTYERRIAIPEAAAMSPERDIGYLVAALCQWSPAKEGQHSLAVYLDGVENARVPIKVVEGNG